MKDKTSFKTRFVWPFLLVVATLLRLALVYDEPLIVRGFLAQDDLLFVKHADSILDGEWLGEFSSRTLLKGPGFPLWLAANAFFGIPVLFAQQVLYVLACALACVAVAWLIPSGAFRGLLYLVLLWLPSSFDGWLFVMQRVGIYSPTTLLVFGTALGMVGAVDRSWARALAWGVGCGLSTGLLWITREEGIWIVPGLGLLIAMAAVRLALTKPSHRMRSMAAILSPVAVATMCVHAVCYVNWQYYDAYMIGDFKSDAFKRGYGALMRAGEPVAEEYLPLPIERRAEVYAVSPTFRSIQTQLEQQTRLIPPERTREDLHAARVGMALRLAMGNAGFYDSHEQATRFYDELAREVNAACDDGRLACGEYRESYVPPWRDDYTERLIKAFGTAVVVFATFDYMDRFDNFSRVNPRTSAMFARVSNTRFAPGGGKTLTREDPDAFAFDGTPIKMRIREQIRTVYSILVPILGIVALVCWLNGLQQDVRNRRFPHVALVVAALLGSVWGKLIMQSYIELTAAFGFFGRYLLPLYPVFVLGAGIAIAYALGMTQFTRSNSAAG